MGASSMKRTFNGTRLGIAFLLVLTFYVLVFFPGMRPRVYGFKNESIAVHHRIQPLISSLASDQESAPAKSASVDATPPCFNLPGASDVLLVLKTGATEIYDKLPPHFLTTFQCAEDYLIYSDLEQDIGTYHILDALKEVSDEIKNTHKDFDLYRTQALLANESQDISAFKGDRGWDLDKWKFLPMVTDAARRFPHKKWLVFMEADTLLSWANLLNWLSMLDPTKSLYIGCKIFLGETAFAHGGSGWVMSGPAAQKLVELEDDKKTQWEEWTADTCCGDQVLASALQDGGIDIMGAWPMIQGETPLTLDWNSENWCSPVISWHHMSANEIDTVWQLEQVWLEVKGSQLPLLFSDVYDILIQPSLQENRTQWDNLSRGKIITAPSSGDDNQDEGKKDDEGDALSALAQQGHASLDACRTACTEVEGCLQYAWRSGECRLNQAIKFGKSTKGGQASKDDEENWIDPSSGWLLDRIEEWTKHSACNNVNWIVS